MPRKIACPYLHGAVSVEKHDTEEGQHLLGDEVISGRQVR